MNTEEKNRLNEALEQRISQIEHQTDIPIKRMTTKDYILAGVVILGCLAAVVGGYYLK